MISCKSEFTCEAVKLKYRDLILQVGGLNVVITVLKSKRITVPKPKEVKSGSSLAEFSKEGYGSKNAVLPMMINVF